MSTTIFYDSDDENEKSIRSQGNFLNDNHLDVDHLGRVIYAEALAQQIETIKCPVTIGIFARWGSGKTFLLKHVQSILMRRQFSTNDNDDPSFFIFLVIIGVVRIILESHYVPDIPPLYIGAILLIIFFLFLIVCFVINASKSNRNKSWYRFSKLIGYSLLTQLPIRENKLAYIPSFVQANYVVKHDKSIPEETAAESKDAQKHRRFIYVNYNAWQYEGCDVLWAGIVTTMAEKIEHEFGILTTRVFRYLALDLVEKPFHSHYTHENGSTNMLLKIKGVKNRPELENILKEVLKNYRIKSQNTLEKWEDNKSLYTEIENKDSWWVIEFEDLKVAKQAYRELKSCHYIKVHFLVIPSSAEKANVKAVENNFFWKHFMAYPRTNFIMIILGILVIAATSIGLLVHFFTQRKIFKSFDQMNAITIVEGVLAIFPPGLFAFIGIIKPFFALFDSHQKQIIKAVQGTTKHFSDKLGFMNTIKKEIQSMTDLIHAIEFTHKIEYKVIITIDDLDRVPLPKVKSVLEAVSILLSDRNSPFICLIAIDSRIANACFTASVKKNDISPTVNGNEYMKKIINLPFCLPEVGNNAKKNFIKGLVDESIKTKDGCITIKASSNRYSRDIKPRNSRRPRDQDLPFQVNIDTAGIERPSSSIQFFSSHFRSFLSLCREQVHTDDNLLKHMSENPRNMKRIFNIVSMTVSLIVSEKKRENQWFMNATGIKENLDEEILREMNIRLFAKQILYWVVLTDQWPYRMSYMLVVIAEDQDFSDEKTLNDVYSRISEQEKDIIYSPSHKELLLLDYEAKVLSSLLRSCSSFMTVGEVKKLLKYTTNLDNNIKKSIKRSQ